MTTKVKVLGVVGGGQMGRGIVQTAAESGLNVLLLDANAELAAQAVAKIEKSLRKLIEKGKRDDAQVAAAMSKIRPCADYSVMKDADFAVEAVPENMKVKRSVMEALDAHLPQSAVLASNTSSISITKLAAMTQRPEKVIGMHFMNPVPVMQLVEVIRALQTSDETYATCRALAETMEKEVIVAQDAPGFVVNRMLVPLVNEAIFALQEGLGTVEDIDTGVKLGLNHPMGPLELADFVGLDTLLSIAEILQRELGEDKYRPAALLRKYVDAGWLGRKSGRGFYDYSK